MNSEPNVVWPGDGEVGVACFFNWHPVGSSCLVEWRGVSGSGEIRLDAPESGLGFALGPYSWRPHPPYLGDLRFRRDGPLFVASCRAFKLAVGVAVAEAAREIAAGSANDRDRLVLYGRLARAAAGTAGSTTAPALLADVRR